MTNYLKNICLIGFALFGPIYLPAGGIQKALNDVVDSCNSREIVLNADCSIYCFPSSNSKELRTICAGSTVSVLKKWGISNDDNWIRVQLVTNIFDNRPNQPIKGWIKL